MSKSPARKLFGTDGMRGIAGQAPLDATTVFAAGLALGHSLRKTAAAPKVILGRDTRESSPWIAATLAAGLRQAGARVESAGVVPTPAVAFLALGEPLHVLINNAGIGGSRGLTADGFERLTDEAAGEYARTVIEGRMASPDGPLDALRPAGPVDALPPG